MSSFLSRMSQAERASGRKLAGFKNFPATMPLGEFLFAYLYRCGVRHSFGVPGDFALPAFALLEKSQIRSVTMTHEPGAGFAADAYSRVSGLGLVCVTYCVGGLNVLNAIAGAYAEKSPVVVVSGAPGRQDRQKDPLLHHKVKTFETQRRVYDEVTVASAVLLDEQRAASEIVRCVEACLRYKRPVYIEIPHDMADRQIPTRKFNLPPPERSDPRTLAASVRETLSLLKEARKPVILAGVELARYRFAGLVVRISEGMKIPIAADLLSKSAVPEDHPLYLGVYGGAMSSDRYVRRYVESADLVLMLGTFITDMSMGFYTAKLDRGRTVLATSERLSVQYHCYDSVELGDFLRALAKANVRGRPSTHPSPRPVAEALRESERSDALRMVDVFRILSLHLDERCCVVADVGDSIFGAVAMRSARQAEFIASAYYMSMGFAVPASIGIALGRPDLRPFALVGDGAFQMTGVEISTAARLGLHPVILVLNNDGYGTMRQIRDGCFNVITQWNYTKICELVGSGDALKASTKGELDSALSAARRSGKLTVIEAKIPRTDISPQLATVSREVAKMRGLSL